MKKIMALVAAGVLAALVVGCKGSDEGSTAPAATTTAGAGSTPGGNAAAPNGATPATDAGTPATTAGGTPPATTAGGAMTPKKGGK
jgi:hypothetical protein